MYNSLWHLLSNPPTKEVQGVKVPAWTPPPLEDRKAMVEEIMKKFKIKRVRRE